jgi:hypothetical protein
MSILLGVNAFAGAGEGARRQAQALERWRGLSGVRLVNLQWADEIFAVDAFETHPVLRADSRTVTGLPGRRLPVIDEAFDRLAEIALSRGARWFGYANSDVEITQGAVDRVLSTGREAYAFSRMDFDPVDGADLEIVTAGIDLFVIRADGWQRHRRRFRAYLGGEAIWDNVYAAILLAHADAVLLNRDPLIRHERHAPSDWRGSPYGRYLNHLAALDRPYFTRWAVYFHQLEALRARGGGEADEMALQRAVFRRRETPAERLLQAGRVVKAMLRRRLGGRP